MSGKVLVTGGAGYIGAHCVLSLMEAGYEPVILDNLSNANEKVLDRLERLGGYRPQFVRGDVADGALLDKIFAQARFEAVIHFAAFKAVGESVAKPLDYYRNNVCGTLVLLEAMRRAAVKTFVFSSSATVYGDPETVPIPESAPRSATNPYGDTKLVVENMLEALHHAEPDWRIARLRYFNPIGAHASGLIGEDPQDIPNNLLPFVTQVAVGRRDRLQIFGNDYDTPDGTGVRDYIHVVDLAEGHVAALDYLAEQGGLVTLNLGTGSGVSVLQMVSAFERVTGQKIPYRIVDRRPGDIATCYADPSLAKNLLGWTAKRDLDDMCRDAWRWQSSNPQGYEGNGGPGG